MTKFITFINLISCLTLPLSFKSEEKQSLNNNDEPPTYASYLGQTYTPAEFVKIGNFDINMNEYVGETRARIVIPFYMLDKTIDLEYELFFVTKEGIKTTLYTGEFKAANTGILPSSGLYSFVFYLNPYDVGECSTFTLRFYDRYHTYNDHLIQFYLTGPTEIWHEGRYARIFYRVILKDGKIYNYEDRIDFLTIADTFICDYYFKFPFREFLIKPYTLQYSFYDSVSFLFYDEFGYFDDVLLQYDGETGYSYIDAYLISISTSERLYSLDVNLTCFVNENTFVSSYFVNGNDEEALIENGLYLPIQKYDLYKEISCAVCLVNVGRTKTTIIHTFELVFEQRYIYSAINTCRGTPVKQFTPKEEEHII